MWLGSRRPALCLAAWLGTIACGGGSPDPEAAGGGGASASASSGTGVGGSAGEIAGTRVVGISEQVGSISEAECSIAVRPDGSLAAAWIELGPANFAIGYAFSLDGGATWSAPRTASPNDLRLYDGPVLAAAPSGAIYLAMSSYVEDAMGQRSDYRVSVATAAPGATAFGAPVDVTDPSLAGDALDKPWITVTPKGTVIVTYADIDAGGIYESRSAGGGAFTHVLVSGGTLDLAYTCPAKSGGRVWITYYDADLSSIDLRWSDDDGATWPAGNVVAVSDPKEGDVAFDDPTCVGDGNDVWIAYALSKDVVDTTIFVQRDDAIRVAHSSDGGAMIDRRVDGEDTAAARDFMLPTIALDDAGGLDLSYYAGDATADPKGSFRLARSTDGAKTFAKSGTLYQPIIFSIERTDATWLGDYAGFVAKGNRVYAAFADNASGFAHIDFASAVVE